MNFRVTVTLKNGVLDPQGLAIEGALPAMGLDGIEAVRQGKVFDVAARDRESVEALCERLLANTVVEDYAIESV